MQTQQNVPVLRIPSNIALPSNDQWQFRFEIRSESSNRIYIVSQNIKKKHWGCSCPGYRTKRKCKHLEALGLPAHETPFEPRIINA